MNEDFSARRLVELLHHYYPLHLHGDDERYGESEQYQRILRLRAQALKDPTSWRRLLVRLREALSECTVEDWTVLFSDDNCWRVRVNLPEVLKLPGGQDEVRTVVVLVSVLAPVYVLYSSFRRYHLVEKKSWPSETFYEDIPETKSYADMVEGIVRDALHVHRLPNETLFTPVPDIQCGNTRLGKAKLIDCLFTDDRW